MTDSGVPGRQLGSEARTHFPELDIVRGLALVFMIANHLGVSTPAGETSGTVWFLTFLGSIAPALFFLVTGLGHGVGSANKAHKRGGEYLTRFLVLIAADAFLWLRPGVLMGNDFLGFIAVSGLLLEGIRRLPRGAWLSLALAALVVAVRFVAGPHVRSHGGLEHGWWPFLLGINSMRGFSYPPCPWLAYPLIGYALGRWAGLNASRVTERGGTLASLLVVAALGCTAPGAWLVWRGGILFRWGTMSISFFLISLGVVAASLALALFLCTGPRLSRLGRALSLSGVRSFSVVPLHYLYRDFSQRAGMPAAGVWGYLVWVVLGVVLCFESSRLVPGLTATLRSDRLQRGARAAIVLMTALAMILVVSGATEGWPDLLIRSVAQLALCVLFGLLSGRADGRRGLEQKSANSTASMDPALQ